MSMTIYSGRQAVVQDDRGEIKVRHEAEGGYYSLFFKQKHRKRNEQNVVEDEREVISILLTPEQFKNMARQVSELDGKKAISKLTADEARKKIFELCAHLAGMGEEVPVTMKVQEAREEH